MTGLLRSWVESANDPETPFPLLNLPYGVLDWRDAREAPCVTAIGEHVLNLSLLEAEGVLKPQWQVDVGVRTPPMLRGGQWNIFMSHGDWADYRAALTDLLAEGGNPRLREDNELRERAFSDLKDAKLDLPFLVEEFTDFYSGRHHAVNVGTMLRGPENALPPQWDHMPIGYNGRASTVVVSGTPVRRPWGQVKSPDHDRPAFQPSRRFDFELELGAVVGKGCHAPVTVAEADAMIFGYVLLNDWSARDIQAWEYQPLGPFQSKATATTISPWVVPRAALEPFRCRTPEPEVELLPYLWEPGPTAYDIDLAVSLTPEGGAATKIARSSSRCLSFSAAQQIAHHTSSGCVMRPGDLIGSGTISGPEKDQRGCLLERTWGGQEPLTLSGGETRTFLEDGDTVTLTGEARGDGYRIGFGACEGTVLPALEDPYRR